MSSTTLIIIVVVAVIVLLLLAVYFSMRRRRVQRSERQRERTREEFGSEYERTAEARGSEEEAERELRERRGRVERQVEPLSEESRGRYEEQWDEVERVFVNNPSRSIELADRTVMEVLEERNFVSDPSQSDEETERSLAVMHPDVADDYREARRIRADVVAGVGRFSKESSEEETTEELRQGIQRYRVVYQRIASG
jgi:FtsZ-interacting cell division protein ZipA